MSKNSQLRDSFGSKFGVIAAAAGSAVGLGNIWKFPYIAGEYGGAAFLFVYLAFIMAIGLPVMLSELIIGRSSRRNAFGAFKVLAPGTPWRYIGILGVSAAFLILSFYGVVAGWSVQYVILSVQDGFSQKSPDEISTLFTTLIESPIKPVMLQLGFMFATGAIVIIGVKKGIEKYTKILMPVLVLILIGLSIKSVSLEGAKAGLEFLFKPDFSKLTGDGILSALGHAFFTLSLGMGTLITYGSYIKRDNNLINTVISVTVADTLIAILAGIAIFPAVFAFGIEPSEGPGLIFITLPNVFHQMPGGYIFSILFFVLLTVAAITSSISILEVVVAYFMEEFKMVRKSSTVLATILISILGVLCSLSMGVLADYKLFGLNIFDLMDWISANMLLPIGGLFIALFTGWYFGRKKVQEEVANGGNLSGAMLTIFIFLVKFVAPIAIAIVILNKVGLLTFS
ncbi:MAG: sodium-dependent transporter [Prolixibacteraceae bacterium]|jgi:neurotransmitter:Na+ symporter, NSS family|nr:sodium-dependent transporter [Prolixibacteraceae bacterium]MBT6763752.1 sodium-dependent transporter [Prolixibacteraceae bacterium]MBT7000660.1 sodium-dependent transporter [Prolixibacteraceae bacterium]MBT7397368.1 sodium-dependent transporter [Prolixibacteraceae bacterium]